MRKTKNWIIKPSISKKLIISFLLVLVIPSLIVGYSAYQSAKSSLESTILNSAKSNVDVLDQLISREVDERKTDMDYMAKALNKTNFTQEKVELTNRVLNQYSNLHKDIETIYIGSATGQFINAPAREMDKNYDPRQRDWYKQATSSNGNLVITSPYTATSTGNLVITIAQQLEDKSGVVGININLDELIKMTKQIKIGKEGYAYIMDPNKIFIAHPIEKLGTFSNHPLIAKMFADKDGVGDLSYQYQGVDKKLFFNTNKLTGWKIAGTMNLTEVEDAAADVFNRTALILLFSILISGVIVYFIIISITRPLRKLVDSSKVISEGDLTEEITIRRKDEIGQLGESFNEMSASLRTLITTITASVDNVAASSEELTASAAQTSKATEHITQAIEAYANGQETQSEEVERNVSQIQEMNTGLQNVAATTSNITQEAVHSTKIAEKGGTLVQQTVTQMNSIESSVKSAETVVKELGKKSSEITKILETMNAIADQTNLLALNAAIEAARAGESGKGFAIVAEEVRKLSEQSSNSAKEIGTLIHLIVQEINVSIETFGQMTKEVQSGIDITKQTEEGFQVLFHSTEKIAHYLDDMNATVEQMSVGSQQVSDGFDQIAAISRKSTSSTQEIAASAEEQLASMEEITASANMLASLSEELQSLIKKFKIE
ncbi:methyl-accepting chemotaxis protein [Niallia sp. 01092]|uniref:methyl-accepting chemotaxis protein n=1 Tax=unclassified Niallia TaxID=2837522 RepID=UPI003FD1785B